MRNINCFLITLLVTTLCCKGPTNNQNSSLVDSLSLQEQSNNFASQHRSSSEEFQTVLQTQPVESLPFSFASFILDSLYNETEYDELLHKLRYSEIDTSSVLYKLGHHYDTNLSQKDIHNEMNAFAPYYYTLLIDSDCECIFSKSYFYKRLPPLHKGFEVFLSYKKIKESNFHFIRGINFIINIYNTETKAIIDQKRILTAGIGKEDVRYFEGFEIKNDYSILIKSYTSVEGESTTIERELKILPDGKITEEQKPIVITEYSEEDYE